MPTILVLELKEASKPFAKKVRMTKFWFKQFLMFCITFPQDGFNFDTQNLQNPENFPFQTLRTFVFDLKVTSKPFYKKLPMANFEFNSPSSLCLAFPENGFNFVT